MHIKHRARQAPQVTLAERRHRRANRKLIPLPVGHIELAQPVDRSGNGRMATQGIAEAQVARQLAGVEPGAVRFCGGPGTQSPQTQSRRGTQYRQQDSLGIERVDWKT